MVLDAHEKVRAQFSSPGGGRSREDDDRTVAEPTFTPETVNGRGTIAELTEGDLAALERDARRAAVTVAARQLEGVNSPADMTLRDLHPHLDLESGADNGWNGTDQEFVQDSLTAGSNTVYDVNSDGAADEKIIIIYAISNIASSPLTSTITFRDGTGGRFEHLQVEDMELDQEITVGLQFPVLFDADHDGEIEQWADASGTDRVVYHGVVAEETGSHLKEQSDSE